MRQIKLVLADQWTAELNELATLQGRSPATGNCRRTGSTRTAA